MARRGAQLAQDARSARNPARESMETVRRDTLENFFPNGHRHLQAELSRLEICWHGNCVAGRQNRRHNSGYICNVFSHIRVNIMHVIRHRLPAKYGLTTHLFWE